MIKVVIKARQRTKDLSELVDAETLIIWTQRPLEIAEFLKKCGMRKKFTFELSREV